MNSLLVSKSWLRSLSTQLSRTRWMATESGMQRLINKTAIVTASTEGIGFAIAKRLGQEGAQVVISSRKEQNVHKSLDELKKFNIDVSGVVCHVAKEEDRKRLIDHTIDKYGKVDILVSNAATNPIMGPIMETSESAWEKIFEVNVKASFLMAKEVYPHLIKQGGGSITFVSSVAGYQAFPMIGTYSISKTALIGLSRALSIELANDNIRVNCVAPGIIKTKFSAAIAGEESAVMVPLGRLGDPEDVSGVVAFLSSNDAAYITGETLVPSGGMFSRL